MSPPRTAGPGSDPGARSASRQRTGTHSTPGHTWLRGALPAALVSLLTALAPAAAGAAPAYGTGSAQPAGTGVTRYPGITLRSSRPATIASIGGGGAGGGPSGTRNNGSPPRGGGPSGTRGKSGRPPRGRGPRGAPGKA